MSPAGICLLTSLAVANLLGLAAGDPDWTVVDAIRASIVENARQFESQGRIAYRVEKVAANPNKKENSIATVRVRWKGDRYRTSLAYIENATLLNKVPEGVPKQRTGVVYKIEFLAGPQKWIVWAPHALGGRGQLLIFRPGAALDAPFSEFLLCNPADFFRRGVPGQGPPLHVLIGPHANHPSTQYIESWEVARGSTATSLVTKCVAKGNQNGKATVTTFIDLTIGLPVKRTVTETAVVCNDSIEWKWRKSEHGSGFLISEILYNNTLGGETQKWTLVDYSRELDVPPDFFDESSLKIVRLTSVDDRISKKRYFWQSDQPVTEQSLRKAAGSLGKSN